MERLTQTPFFQMMSETENTPASGEAELSAAYMKFINLVVQICIAATEGVPTYFTLNYTHIELSSIMKTRENSSVKDAVVDRYLLKATLVIESAIEWMYIYNDIAKSNTIPNMEVVDSLKWTGKVVEFIELAYALQEAKVINSGELATKNLISFLCVIFKIEIGDCFSHYMNIRNRVENRTKFIDKLKSSLELPPM